MWIATVARLGLAIITRDKHIQTRTAEINAVAASNARMFAITSDENLNPWGLVEVVASRWRDMESAATLPGPQTAAAPASARHPAAGGHRGRR